MFWFWKHRDQVSFSLNQLYKAIPLSKQSIHEWIDRQFTIKDEWEQLVPVIRSIREEHPGLSARKLYGMIQPQAFGRDKFIDLCMQCGFRLEMKRNEIKTTNSLGVTRFPNLIKSKCVKRVNQVWVSDITYYRISERIYFITFIMDLKSRFIVGYYVSKTLATEDTTIPALKKAILMNTNTKGLILHSDGGGQYYCKEYLTLTKKHGIRNSMTNDTGENNYAERINGTIKNQYLSGYMPTTFDDLVKQTARAVKNYNFGRPHDSLKLSTPAVIYGYQQKVSY